MKCPYCKGKVKVTDIVYNPLENETYRQRKCLDCDYKFYTVEYEVIQNDRFKDEWTIFTKLQATESKGRKNERRK